jgi:hypothetical protein
MVLSASKFCLTTVRSREAINHEACPEMQIIFVKVDRAVSFFSPQLFWDDEELLKCCSTSKVKSTSCMTDFPSASG